MFEKIVEKILSPILSEYVEDFNAQNMKIGLWSGQVVIKNVRLRKEIIKKLNLPLKIKYSRLGCLKMTIPWKSLGSSKIDIVIEGLQLLITQLPQSQWECKNHKIIEARKQQLTNYCESIIQDFAKKSANADKDEEQKGYFGGMVTKIIDNIQVTIKDIHVRYEDEINKKYSFGVTLEELKVFTVNKNGEPEFIDRSKKEYENEPLRKRLILSNFGLYWNERSQFYNDPQPHSEMLLNIARINQPSNNKMNYLILMSSNAELYQRQAGQQYVQPEINLFIKFQELKVKITNQQLQQIVTMSERFQNFLNQVKFQNRKKLTQEEMRANHKQFIAIFPSYFEKKAAPEQIKRVQQILEKMEVQNFKDGVKSYLQLKQKEKMIQDRLDKKKGWFSFSKPKDLTQEQMKEIENFVKDNFGLETKIIKRPEDFYYLKVNFTLKLLNLSIANTKIRGKTQEGLSVNLQQIGMDFSLREGGYLLNFGIGDINVNLYNKELQKAEILDRTNILKKMPEETVEKKLGKYVILKVVGSPLEKKYLDTEINLDTEQLLLEFDPRILKVAKDFANIKVSSKNTEAAMQAYGEIKNKVSTSASSAADNIGKTQKKKNFISLDVNIRTINLVLYFDPLKTSDDIWAISLGQTKIFSDPQTLKKSQFTPEEPIQKYCMSTTNMSMIHYRNKQAFFYTKTSKAPVDARQVVLKELGVDFQIEMFKKSSDKTPSIRAKVAMHSLNLNLSHSTYPPIQKIGECFTIPIKVEAEVKQQIEQIKANEKTEIMKQSKKIGIIFEQSSKEPKKYIGVLSAGYLYLYNDKKDIQYSTYYYVRNSKLAIQKESDIAKRPFSLVVDNPVNKVRLGFDKQLSAEEWSKAIKSLETQNQFIIREPVGQEKPEEQPVKAVVNPNNLNFEVLASIQTISIHNFLHADRKADICINSLTAHAKLHETKTMAKVSLKSLQISDNIYNYKYKELTNFLYSESIQGKQKLIDITFQQLQEKNPEYKEGGSAISIEVGKLICNYKPETVQNLMRFLLPKPEIPPAKKLTKQDQKMSIDSGNGSSIHHDEHQTEEQIKKRKLQNWTELKKQPEKYTIKLNFKVEEISIALVNRKTRTMFAKLGLDDFKLDFGLSNKKMDIQGGIKQLWLSDYSNYPNTIIEEQESYTEFMHIIESFSKGRDMVTFDIKILEYPNEANKMMIIKAGLNDLSVSYIQQPVLRMITYLTEQLLPSLTPSSDQSKPKQAPIMLDTKPENSTMDIIVDLQNVIAVVKPRNGNDEYLQLVIKTIAVRNSSLQRPYIKNPANQSEKVLVENYDVKLSGISIIQKFKGKENKLTNDLSIDVGCQLIQNTLYYQKTYGNRYSPGMRVNCKLSPFLMRLNHQDYNFIMKCLFWNITFDDNAQGYLYDPIIKPINKETKKQAASEPLYCNITMDRIILCVTEDETPLSVLFLAGLSLNISIGQVMNILFQMKNIFATHINQTNQQNVSIERGMFNLFGHERILKTSQLRNLQSLVQIYSIKSISESVKNVNLKFNSDYPTIFVEYQTNKFGDTLINARIIELKIAVQLKKLLILSKLALIDDGIQPPKSALKPIAKKTQAPPPPASSGKMIINLEMKEFLGCVGDRTGKNYVVMEGDFIVKLKMTGSKSEDDVIEMGKRSEIKDGPFMDMNSHSVELRNFSLYFCNLANLKNKRYILQPLRLILIYTQQYGIKKDVVYMETDIQGQLEKIIIECSVRDMLMVNKIAQDNIQILSQSSASKQQLKKKQAQKQKQLQVKSQISSLKNQDYEIDKQAIQKAVKQVQKKIKDRTIANMRLEPIQIRVVNDCNNNFMPVLNLIIQESNLMFSADAIKSHLASAFTLKLDFFNPRSANWEPVIESFGISVDYLTLLSEFGPTSKIIISSSVIEQLKQLKINASTQLVSSLLATLDIAKSESKKIDKIENENQIEVSPYIIQNLTNKTIFVQRIINGEASAFQLKPLYKGPVKLTDLAEELNFVYEGKKYSVSLEKFGIVNVEGLDDIHLDFKMDKLNRVLTFVNNMIIKNATSNSIYCIRYNEKKQPLDQSMILKPGDSVPLEKEWFVQLSPNNNTFTVMTKASNLSQTFYLKNQKQTYKIAINEKRLMMGHSIFMARAPFSILNCLPKNVQIQFISGKKQVSSKVIPAQQSHEVFASQDILNLKFKILCEGFYWSQEFWAQETRFNKQSYLFLSDRQEGGTTIKYIFEKDVKKGQYRLNLFCPAFIVSQIDYDLQIYSNLERDEAENSIQKYYKLGGQNKYWRKGQSQEGKKIDKKTLIGVQSGSKIRVCGQNCLIDFSQPILTKNIGVSQTRIVVQTQLHGKKASLFTVLGVDVSLKKMALKADIYSRQITLRARWIFFNNSNYDLQVKQQGGERFYYQINKNQKKPFYFIVPELKDKPKGLIFRSQYTGESIPVYINNLGSIYFRIQKQNELNSFLYFKLNIQQIDSYLFYEITQVSYEHLPYQVVVKSQKLEAYVQLFQRQLQKDSPPLMFINQVPSQPYNLPILIRPIGSEIHQELTVQADNLNFKAKMNLNGIPAVVYVIFNDSKKYIVIDELKTDPEQTPEYEVQTINFRLQKLSFSLIQNHTDQQRAFQSFFFYMQDLQFMMQKSNKRSKYQLKLQFLQLDQDEPYNIPNPVIITPIKYKQFTSHDPKDKPKSIFNALVEVDNSFVKNMFFNKIVIDVNDLVIKIGSPFIKLILQIYKQYSEAAKGDTQYLIKNQIDTWQKIVPPPEGSKTFIKSICLAPFTINLSAQVRLSQLDSESVVIFGTILNALGVVITNIEDAPIVLDGIALNDCNDSIQGINSKLISHYKAAVLGQLYKIFGSLNIIGNPVSLFRNISTGFKDLKEKPADGFVEGPLEFGKGLAEGTSSLIMHSVGGALNSVQKVTGTIASGLAALTFDKQFQQKRERERMKKPKHVFQGLQKGGKAVFHGFKQGLTGLVLKPYQNAQKQGAIGFFKGVAQGITGVVVKPVTGVIDFASKTTEGLKNTALYLEDKPNENRIRYPRVLYTQTGMVRQYDAADSKIFSIVRKNKYEEKYNLSNDYYMESFRINNQNFLVVLSSAIVLIKLDEQAIIWSIPLSTSKINRVKEDVVKVQGCPKNLQFWEKGVSESVRFETKQDAEKFQKLIVNMKDNAGRF